MPKFTEFHSTGVATKTLTMVEGKLQSDKRPNLTNGIGRVVDLPLEAFPAYLSSLESQFAISTGTPIAGCSEFRFSTKKKMEKTFGVACYHDDAGWQLARVAEQFRHDPESCLMVFDHDPSDFADGPKTFETPEQFVAFLCDIEPAFKGAAYVARYSTSANVYYKGERVSKASGFHVYFSVKLGSRTQQEVNEHLYEQAWLNGFGYVAVSASGALLTRVPFDTAVSQTNRVMYEAPAVLNTDGLAQNNPAWYVDGIGEANLSKIAKPNSNTKTRERRVKVESLIAAAKDAPEIQRLVRDVKTSKLNDFMSKKGYSQRQAEKALDLHLSGTLDLEHVLYFDDGREVTVMDLMTNWSQYDGLTLADPLEPEKGPCKAQFYGNNNGTQPVIHTFVRGEGNYYLNDSFASLQLIKESDQLAEFKAQGWNCLECGFTESDKLFDFDLPQSKLICLIGDQGTGKTYQTAKWQHNGDLGRILSVAPKIALVMDTASRLSIPSYSEDEIQGANALLANGIATTLDSVYKFANYPVDTLFLDEFEQTLTHLTAPTLKNRRAVLSTLKTLFKTAKRIILADADLSPVSISYLMQWGLMPYMTPTVLFNHYQACAGGVVHMLDTEATLKQQILKTVRSGEGVYIANNKRGGIHEIVRAILKTIPPKDLSYRYKNGDFIIELSTGQRILVITKDNSGNPEVGEFTKTINESMRSDDILITSPSLSTGVSINILHGLPLLKHRFLVSSSMVGTVSSDSIQQLERIRGGDKCETYVYVDSAKHKLTTDTSLIITQELHKGMIEFCRGSGTIVSQKIFYNCENQDYNDLDVLYELIYGYVKRRVNLDRNNFANQLRSRLTRKGYLIRDIIETLDSDTKALLKAAREDQREYDRDLLIQAPLLNTEEEAELRDKKFHTPEETAMLEKTKFAKLLGESNDAEMKALLELPKAQQRTLQEAMLLGVSDGRCAEIDFSTIVRKSSSPAEVEGIYERKRLMLDLLMLVGVTFDQHGLPQKDNRVLYPEDLNTIYAAIRGFDEDETRPGYSRIKAMLNVTVPFTDDNREQGKVIANVYRHCGIIFRKTTVRNTEVKNRVIHVRYVDVDWLNLIRNRIDHARKHSQHEWFTHAATVPPELTQYIYAAKAGMPEMYPNMHLLFKDLNKEYRELFESMASFGESSQPQLN